MRDSAEGVAVRRLGPQPARMTRRKRDIRAILRTIEQSEERSPLFWWMVEHHDDMVQASTGTRIRWAAFCAEAARKGLTDTRGRPPTERNARETWLQARKAVAAGRAKLEAAPPRGGRPKRAESYGKKREQSPDLGNSGLTTRAYVRMAVQSGCLLRAISACNMD
jgi:hypothetical protein